MQAGVKNASVHHFRRAARGAKVGSIPSVLVLLFACLLENWPEKDKPLARLCHDQGPGCRAFPVLLTALPVFHLKDASVA
jgi:hypothetical protein